MNSEEKKESVVLPIVDGNDEKNVMSAAAEKNNDINTNNSENETIATDILNNSPKANDNTTPIPSSSTNTADTPTSKSPGFFSRIGTLGNSVGSGAPLLGDKLGNVYEKAQKRAVELHEQAVTEVERLRQQQQQKEEDKLNNIVIPPSSGTVLIVDGSEVTAVSSSELQDVLNNEKTTIESSVVDGAAKDGSTPKVKETKSTTFPNVSSPLRDAFNIVRQQSLQSAERLVFPVEAFATGVSDDDATAEKGGEEEEEEEEDDDSRYLSPDSSNVSSSRSQEDDSSNVSSPEKEGSEKKEVINTTSSTSTSSLTPTRFTGVFNATVGRYRRRLQESASFDSSSSDQQQQQSQQQQQPQEVLVGGADRVGGLRYFQLDSIIDKDAMSSKLLPPTMPFSTKPPGQENLVKETGGQWTMASNRGQNAVINPATNSHTSFSRSPSWDATSTTAASETGSAISDSDGSKNRLPPSSAASPKPSHKSTRTPSYYEEAVRAVLQPGQRALFFGKGTMGVVLKPTYHASWRGKDGGGLLSPTTASKKGGVFIDSMIAGGHADKTGVVFVGDHVIKIGAVNVESMTLEEVVTVISQTKRPNIMVVTSEHSVKVVDKPKGLNGEAESNGEKGFVSQLDLTFGFVNKLVAEGEGSLSDQDLVKDHELKQVVSRNSLLDNDDEEEDSEEEEEVSFKSPSKGDDVATVDVDTDKAKDEETETASEANNVGKEPERNSVDANTSAADDLGFLSVYASHRTNNYDTSDTDIRHQRTSLLKRSALFNQHFRSALHGSLLECVLDPRKYSFLEHYFKNYQSKKQMDAKAENGATKEAKLDDGDDVTSAINQRRLLELYVELCKFHDAMMVCSESEREKLLGYARDISTRFLEDSDQGSNRNCLLERVSQVALGGMEKVQAVRFALNDEDSFFEEDNGDGFESIRSSLGAFLSTQEAFLSFLISNECASMRAYLRGCSPFLQIEPHMFLKPPLAAEEEDASTHNLLLHAIFHLVCMKENDEDEEQGNFIRNDALRFNTGKRNLGASSLLGCSSFIMRKLQKSIEAVGEGLIEDGMMGNSNNLPLYSSFIEQMQFFWEVYVAPAGGALSSLMLSQDAQKALDNVRRLLVSSVDEILAKEESKEEPMTTNVDMARALSSGEMSTCIVSLAEALLREYTLKIYPDFQRFIFFEWACKESKEHRFDTKACSNTSYVVKSTYNGMSNGFLNRALRQIEFPHGMSLHRPPPSMDISPTLTPPASDTSSDCLHNGDVALVFGSDTDEEDEIRRFSCVSLQPETSGPRKVVLPEDVPPIFESYASVPPFNERPFQGMLKNEKNNRMSIDGWEISLTNFVIPSQGSGESDDDKWMYCVSLVFRKSFNAAPQVSEREINNACVQELQHDDSLDETTSQDFKSPLSMSESEDDEKKRTMKVSQELKQFNCKLQEKKWSQQVGQGSTIGLALISSRNVTSAMRETLSLLYEDFCGPSNEGQDAKRAFPKKQHLCQPLVDILGTLHTQEIEATSLGCVLQPYLTHTTSRWVHRPLSDQADIFAKAAGMQLLQALPPVPLALAFVTLLLEQKVVFASSRRGMLMSASFAMTQLLKPLKWAHLQVPLVPVSMLDELIHYPAPFMLGIPTDEKKSAAVLGSLPNDVTLIDLDVGRVILASEFSNDTSKTSEGINSDAVAGALRSQVLFLSECLGGSFGAAIYRNSWCSDSPLQTMSKPTKQCTDNDFTEVLHICEDFISEFISGIHSCCLWIEEKHDSITTRNESAIIFDEDRFYHIKNLRAEGRYLPLIQKSDNLTADKLSLSLDQFDLIFETFLRTQCLSTYISEGDKELMLFS